MKMLKLRKGKKLAHGSWQSLALKVNPMCCFCGFGDLCMPWCGDHPSDLLLGPVSLVPIWPVADPEAVAGYRCGLWPCQGPNFLSESHQSSPEVTYGGGKHLGIWRNSWRTLQNESSTCSLKSLTKTSVSRDAYHCEKERFLWPYFCLGKLFHMTLSYNVDLKCLQRSVY